VRTAFNCKNTTKESIAIWEYHLKTIMACALIDNAKERKQNKN
jgi:hypothetical protein